MVLTFQSCFRFEMARNTYYVVSFTEEKRSYDIMHKSWVTLTDRAKVRLWKTQTCILAKHSVLL